MNFKKIFSTCIFATLIICSTVAQKATAISSVTFKNLIGCWQGTLNYSGTIIRKPYTTTANLVIKQISKTNKFEFLKTYTKELNDNSSDTIIISKNGRKINGAMIKSKWQTSEKNLKIVTEVPGFDHDNNKAAIVRHTYTIGKDMYTFKKEVQLQGQSDWLEREEFIYTRKACN